MNILFRTLSDWWQTLTNQFRYVPSKVTVHLPVEVIDAAQPKSKRKVKGKTSVVTNDQMSSIVLDYHNYLHYKEKHNLPINMHGIKTSCVDDLVLLWNIQFGYTLSKRSYLRLIEKFENQQG